MHFTVIKEFLELFYGEKNEIKTDFDFWYNPTNENFAKLIKALKELSVDVSELERIVFDAQKTYLKIPHPTFHTDFLPQMKGLPSYRDCKKRSQKVALDENEIYVISKEDLLINKQSVNRSIDKQDFDSLR